MSRTSIHSGVAAALSCCIIVDFLELPVTSTQKYRLFHPLNQRSIHLWKTQVEMILAKNGLASFIIHPDYIIGT